MQRSEVSDDWTGLALDSWSCFCHSSQNLSVLSKTPIAMKSTWLLQSSLDYLHRETSSVWGTTVGISNSHWKRWRCRAQLLTWMEGLFRWPKFDVVCLGSWPSTIMLALINLKASMTTCRRQIFVYYILLRFRIKRWSCIVHLKWELLLQEVLTASRLPYLSFDTLNGINHHCHSSLRQGFEALLCVDVHPRQPTAETRVTMVPAHHHLRPDQQHGRGQ